MNPFNKGSQPITKNKLKKTDANISNILYSLAWCVKTKDFYKYDVLLELLLDFYAPSNVSIVEAIKLLPPNVLKSVTEINAQMLLHGKNIPLTTNLF